MSSASVRYSYFLSSPSHLFVVCAQGTVVSMYAAIRENHAEMLRAVRAQHGPGNGQVVPKTEDFKNVAKIWCKDAINQRLMMSGLFRVLDTDPEHVNVLSVIDEFPMDFARHAGIPTSGALCAKATPQQFATVSAASL